MGTHIVSGHWHLENHGAVTGKTLVFLINGPRSCTGQKNGFAQICSHPRRPRGSQLGRVKRRDKSFQAWAEEPLGTDSHRTISKRSRECWFLIGHKKCFVLLCPIGEQHLLSSFREIVHDGYYLATVVRFVHQAFLTRNEGTTDESKNVSDAISRSRFTLRKFCF